MTTNLEVPAQCPHCGDTALRWDLESFLPNFADPGFGTRVEVFLECQGCSREVLRVTQSAFLDFINDGMVTKAHVVRVLNAHTPAVSL